MSDEEKKPTPSSPVAEGETVRSDEERARVWSNRRVRPHFEKSCSGLTTTDCVEAIGLDLAGLIAEVRKEDRARYCQLSAGDFVRIHNGGGRGRIVRGPCYVIASDQGGYQTEDAANVALLVPRAKGGA